MPRLVDLTDIIDPAVRDRLPDYLKHMAMAFAPNIQYVAPTAADGIDSFCKSFQCNHDDLPYGEGWGGEFLHDFSTHCGTHVDAPLHSGSRCEGRKSRTITDIKLEELYRPGLVLDVRPWAKGGEEITPEMLDMALEATGKTITQGDAVLIRTGQEKFTPADREYFFQPGMSRRSTLHLLHQGAKILGTDALGWDRPFSVIAETFRETGDKMELWDGHKAIVEREGFIVQQLVNLGALPLSGFMVGFFPLKLLDCSAAPARVVAFVD